MGKINLRLMILIELLIALLTILAIPNQAAVRAAPPGQERCGTVDAIDYPIDGISLDHDDFGMYRAVFNGRHTGIDMAFDRYGEPVQAAARGRVTYSDVAGWDTEKGVVIIEHTFPDGNIYYSLYGHMEEANGRKFPTIGQCVQKGDVVGAIGNPSRGAPHLHYEIRRIQASSGGPGYWSANPLDGGWFHPIDFTEQWRLRFSPAFRRIMTAGSGPVVPPLWQPDGSAIFAGEYHLEQRNTDGETAWRLDIQGLSGVVTLPDGRILGRTSDDKIIIVEGTRFAASWQADRPLRSAPIRLGDSVIFVTRDSRVVSYDADGKLRWSTEPLGTHIERYAQSGDLLAVSAGQDQNGAKGYQLSIINSSGAVRYQAAAPAPVMPVPAAGGGFIIMVGSQIGLLAPDLSAKTLMDVGLALGRTSQIALDPQGNALIYPGYGQYVYLYNAKGGLRWQAKLTGPQMQPPLVGMGAGCLAYVLTADGALVTYRTADGALRGMATLYAGGSHGHPEARFLNVSADDQVQFSAGYLTIATIDGPTLANDCKRS
jgi:murein DD-endopeptidase MepM/ murein hydrolase activator NlpD